MRPICQRAPTSARRYPPRKKQKRAVRVAPNVRRVAPALAACGLVAPRAQAPQQYALLQKSKAARSTALGCAAEKDPPLGLAFLLYAAACAWVGARGHQTGRSLPHVREHHAQQTQHKMQSAAAGGQGQHVTAAQGITRYPNLAPHPGQAGPVSPGGIATAGVIAGGGEEVGRCQKKKRAGWAVGRQ